MSSQRLASLDALRGADMLLIVGLREVVASMHEVHPSPFLAGLVAQFTHSDWNGFTAWDLVFPLFLFLAGVALPYSFDARRARGDDERTILKHIVTRAALLVAIGVVYNGLFPVEPLHWRYASVLGRIGLAWAGAALLVLYVSPRAQVLWCVGILLGAWATLTLVPVPGFGAGDLAPGHSSFAWLDRMFLPGRLYRGDHDPEGLLGTVPAVANTLLGVFAGRFLRRSPRSTRTSLVLVVAGALLLGLGWLWDLALPVNKNLWTSSFVCVTGGWSCLLLGLVHQIADVFGGRRLLLPFTVIGTNALTAYLLHRFVDLEGLVELLSIDVQQHPHLAPAAALGLLWLLLAGMHRRRLFVRL